MINILLESLFKDYLESSQVLLEKELNFKFINSKKLCN
jgi:hypothetical protein